MENLISKLSKYCFAIKIIKSFANKNTVKPLYFAYLHSFQNMLFYFGENLQTLKNFKLQKRAIRLITNIAVTTRCKPYFKKLKIMTLPSTYIYEILQFTKMFLSRCKTHSMFHSHAVSHIYLLRCKTPNYSEYCLQQHAYK